MITKIKLADLPAESQLWIYQSDKPFAPGQLVTIDRQLSEFVQNWESHGAPVTGAYEIINEQFIIIAANASDAPSGCSIDSSVKVIREIEVSQNCSLLNKGLISYENKGTQVINLPDIPTAVKEGLINPKTIIYNNSVNTVSQFLQNWKVPADESWMKRYF